MKHGEAVSAFEAEFARYVGARYAIALCNGTATLHTALTALGVKAGDRVAVPPLTMSATAMAVLQAGAEPRFVDVDADTWTMCDYFDRRWIGVDLYGLRQQWGSLGIADSAQTLRQHDGAAFTSYSFQRSKILSTGEGGMLVTNDEGLATLARSLSSLGYDLYPHRPRIDVDTLKRPDAIRHVRMGWNYRMNDATAEVGLRALMFADKRLADRRDAFTHYADALLGCDWLQPQHIPEGWTHDAWAFALACETPEQALLLQDAVVRHGGERPYGCWRLTYHEPAFKHLAPADGCPNAEYLQPRLLQFQTNDLRSAWANANALRLAVAEIGGAR